MCTCIGNQSRKVSQIHYWKPRWEWTERERIDRETWVIGILLLLLWTCAQETNPEKSQVHYWKRRWEWTERERIYRETWVIVILFIANLHRKRPGKSKQCKVILVTRYSTQVSSRSPFPPCWLFTLHSPLHKRLPRLKEHRGTFF